MHRPRCSGIYRLLELLFLAVVPAICMGCAAFSVKKPELRIELDGPAELNEGIPCNFLIRTVSTQTFRGESYAQVARLAAQADASVLHSGVIYSPRNRAYQSSVVVSPPKQSSVGVYVLFTTPAGNWRLLLEPPLPARLRIELGRSSIQASNSN